MKDEFFGIDFSVRPSAASAEEDCSLPVLVVITPQRLCALYEAEQAFAQGTLFPDLDKPFLAGGAVRG